MIEVPVREGRESHGPWPMCCEPSWGEGHDDDRNAPCVGQRALMAAVAVTAGFGPGLSGCTLASRCIFVLSSDADELMSDQGVRMVWLNDFLVTSRMVWRNHFLVTSRSGRNECAPSASRWPMRGLMRNSRFTFDFAGGAAVRAERGSDLADAGRPWEKGNIHQRSLFGVRCPVRGPLGRRPYSPRGRLDGIGPCHWSGSVPDHRHRQALPNCRSNLCVTLKLIPDFDESDPRRRTNTGDNGHQPHRRNGRESRLSE
jgi:hypothetical protein